MNDAPRHAVVSADDHGPLLAMTAWFLICTLILCTAIRLGVRFATRSPRTADDLLILAAALLAIGGTIAGSFAVESGFGKRISLLTPAALEKIQQELYTTTILYVLTIGVAKLSITTFLQRLACTSNHKASVVVLYAVVISWTFAFTTGVLFECELPRPWAVFNGKCIPMLPFWVIASLVDVFTDIAMIILPIRIVSSLQLPPRKKAAVISTFALRTLLILLSITRVILLDNALHGDWSFDNIPYVITTQAYSTISVLVACLPGLKPFMDSVRTGMLSASLAKRDVNKTFGQDSWGARPRVASKSTVWGSISHGRSSIPSDCLEEASMYVSDDQGRITTFEKPGAASICPVEASIYFSEGLGSIRSRDRPNVPIICQAEASTHCSEVLSRSTSHRELSNSTTCPAETSTTSSKFQARSRPHDRPSAPTMCPAEASIYFFEGQGRIKPRPKSVAPPAPTWYTPAATRKPSFGSKKETPPRPSPPPEELRPDLTCFQSRLLGTNSTLVSGERKTEAEGREKRKGVITQTRRWEVRMEGGCI